DLVERVEEQIRANAGMIAGGFLSGAVIALELVAGALLTVVILFFFLKDGERIWSWVVGLFPPSRRSDVAEVGTRAWETLGGFLRGTAVVATFNAFFIGLALFIIGVPLVVPLALLTFFGSFIPLAGAFVAGFAAVMVALVSEGFVSALIVLGVILVVAGLLAILGQQLNVDIVAIGWPLFVIVPGVLLLAGSLFVGGRPGIGLAIPGGIVTMTGLVLAFQNATDTYQTWAYAWALVAPGGVGVGLVTYGLLAGERDSLRAGVPVLLTGLGLFLAFGFFFEGILGLSGGRVPGFENAFAIGLIALGVVVLGVGVVGRRSRT
ncbi:MAG: AI-2E family transporter, partial [Gaiellaceae bacterium]